MNRRCVSIARSNAGSLLVFLFICAVLTGVSATPFVALRIEDDSGVISMGERLDVNISRTVTGAVAVNTDLNVAGKVSAHAIAADMIAAASLTTNGTLNAAAVVVPGDVASGSVHTGSVTATSLSAGSGALSAGAAAVTSLTTNGGPIAAGAIVASGGVDAGAANVRTNGNVTANHVLATGLIGGSNVYTGPNTLKVPSTDFPTIESAYSFVRGKALTYPVTIKVADGTYTTRLDIRYDDVVTPNMLRVIGNVASPSACELRVLLSNTVIFSVAGVAIEISGFRFQSDGIAAVTGLSLSNRASVSSATSSLIFANLRFGIAVSDSSISLYDSVFTGCLNSVTASNNAQVSITNGQIGGVSPSDAAGYGVSSVYRAVVVMTSVAVSSVRAGLVCGSGGDILIAAANSYVSIGVGTAENSCKSSSIDSPLTLTVPSDRFPTLMIAWQYLQGRMISAPVTIQFLPGTYNNFPSLVFADQPFGQFITILGSTAAPQSYVINHGAIGSTVLFQFDVPGVTIAGLTLNAVAPDVGYAVYGQHYHIEVRYVIFNNFFTAVRAENAAYIIVYGSAFNFCEYALYAIKMSFINTDSVTVTGLSTADGYGAVALQESHIAFSGSIAWIFTSVLCDGGSTIQTQGLSMNNIGLPGYRCGMHAAKYQHAHPSLSPPDTDIIMAPDAEIYDSGVTSKLMVQGVFTCPRTGKYAVSGSVCYAAGGTGTRGVRFSRQRPVSAGAAITYFGSSFLPPSDTKPVCVTSSDVVSAASDDLLRLIAHHTDSGSINLAVDPYSGAARFTVQWIGE